ncbi:helicase-exonuclease AddAB subunit AddB [Lysinibacillus sp. 2017]|uniref:helicase-exonuclease AddAB subunit AddB n=1 Tax=unclassified Lysinibacillus TaxID=2636778 RepID=UPI000D526D55|nr:MULTISPECIES: helicase-exonuclease AddAB subunit AddB [unclassified Lysinibacillus]AWE06428.1 helicase-exonuclease AddAB subunit AddB [Lysinibacillus sp. 2017]TGN32023.1 helicase-exonuclease AddAB subunit AddB [Lysinibacillus sp. S2017]
MTLRVISGRAGTGKTTFIHQEIVDDLKTNALGNPIFILVPDQMTFSTEYELTNNYGIEGMMRAQVMTFKRLAWFVLQKEGGIARERIDGTGYRMLLRRILEEHKDEFLLFKQAAGKRGFTKEVEQILKEFSQYNINLQSIEVMIDALQQNGASEVLLHKMHDLQIILQQLDERIGAEFIDGDGYFPMLIERMPQMESLRDTDVYLDGFVSFNGQEFAILKELLIYAKRVTLVLPMDDPTVDKLEGSVFYRAAMSYEKLQHEIQKLRFERGIEIEVEPRIHLQTNYRSMHSDLLHVEQSFEAPFVKPIESDGHLQILEGMNPRAEVQGIAQEIKRLVTEEKLRYKDIGIMYRQVDVYDAIIGTTFKQYEIPFFSNEKRSMLYHPFIEFSRSVVEIITSNWKFEPVFRSVKTDFYFPYNANLAVMRDRADVLENFVIAKGIVHDRWFNDDVWHYRRFKSLEKINSVQTEDELEYEKLLASVRDLIREPVGALQKRLKGSHITGRQIVVALYEFMEQLDVYKKLVKMQEQEEQTNALHQSFEHEQAWNGWVHILEQFDLMFGDKEIALEDAAQILDEGFESLQFSSVPPTLDEVTVSTLEFARFDNKKAIFIIGVNDGVYPMRMDSGGLLSDDERETFEKSDVELAPGVKSRLLQESFLFYRAISSPTEYLYVTYSSADEESKGKLPSIYVNRLHKMFEIKGQDGEIKRTVTHKQIVMDPLDEKNEAYLLDYLRHPQPAIGFLMTQLKQAQFEKRPLPEAWNALKAFYEREPEWQHVLNVVTKPLYHVNEAEPLTEEMATELYGENFLASVSRIEKFYSCPYSHFASYGLKLQERTEFKLESFAMGDLFHEAIRSILSEKEQVIPLNNYIACYKKANETITKLVDYFSYSILKSSHRFEYIKTKLVKIVARTLFALINQSDLSKFKAIAHEKPFGKRDDKNAEKDDRNPLEALKIDLDDNRKMFVRGQIDRIDAYKDAENLYLRVIDYKSSGRKLDFTEVYNGISLQLLTYLDVAMQNVPILAKESKFVQDLSELENIIVQAAGMFYLHVHNPLVSTEDYEKLEKIESLRQEKFKLSGYMLKDVEVAQLMDTSLEPNKASIIVPAAFKSAEDPEFNGRSSKVIEPQQMENLQEFVHHKFRSAGNEIYRGNTEIKPYSLGNQKACTFCSFKAVCQFDQAETGNSFNELKKQSEQEVFENIEKVVCLREDSNETE